MSNNNTTEDTNKKSPTREKIATSLHELTQISDDDAAIKAYLQQADPDLLRGIFLNFGPLPVLSGTIWVQCNSLLSLACAKRWSATALNTLVSTGIDKLQLRPVDVLLPSKAASDDKSLVGLPIRYLMRATGEAWAYYLNACEQHLDPRDKKLLMNAAPYTDVFSPGNKSEESNSIVYCALHCESLTADSFQVLLRFMERCLTPAEIQRLVLYGCDHGPQSSHSLFHYSHDDADGASSSNQNYFNEKVLLLLRFCVKHFHQSPQKLDELICDRGQYLVDIAVDPASPAVIFCTSHVSSFETLNKVLMSASQSPAGRKKFYNDCIKQYRDFLSFLFSLFCFFDIVVMFFFLNMLRGCQFIKQCNFFTTTISL